MIQIPIDFLSIRADASRNKNTDGAYGLSPNDFLGDSELSGIRMRYAWILIVLIFGFAYAQESQPQNSETRQLEQDIQSYEQLLEERRAAQAEIDAALQETSAELDAQLAERDRLNAEIGALQEQRAELTERVTALNQDLEATRERIRNLQERLTTLETRLQALLVNLHKERGGRYARLLAESESIFDLRVKSFYLSRLTEQDVSLIQEMNRTVAELQDAQLTLSTQIEELNAQEAQLAENQTALQSVRENLAGVIAQLEETRQGQLAQQQTLLNEQADIEQTLLNAEAALQEELARLRRAAELARRREAAAREREAAARERQANRDAEEQQRQAAEEAVREWQQFSQEAEDLEDQIRTLETPTNLGDGEFTLPFANPGLVSGFSEGGASQILLKAEQPGTAVRAVKGGTVWRVRRISANSGYLVAILNGPELITAYSNLQFPDNIAIGDQVEQGQIIGYLGGGTLTPPDTLQFRMGTPQGEGAVWYDPAPYLGF